MANQLRDYPAVTVGTTAAPITTVTDGNEGNFAPHASISVQADPANSGTVFVGSSLVSTTRYAAALTRSLGVPSSSTNLALPSSPYHCGKAVPQTLFQTLKCHPPARSGWLRPPYHRRT